MKKISIIVLIALVVPAALFAQDDDWRNRRGRDRDRDNYRWRGDSSFELTPFVGYTYGGTLFADQTGFTQDFDAESNMNFGADFAIPLGNQGFKLELMANRQPTHLTTGGGLFEPNDRVADFDVSYYHAGLVIPFAQSRSITPYVVVSAGVATLDIKAADTSSENRFSASAGIGVKVPINSNFGLRAEARGFYTALPQDNGFCRRCGFDYGNQDFYQGQTNLGVYFRF